MKCELLLVCALFATVNSRSVRAVKGGPTGTEVDIPETPVSSEDENPIISSFALPHASPSSKCQCDWRYLKHYATKKCIPVFEEGCDCPVRFDCPELDNTQENVCEYKGKTYELGDEINATSECGICSCRSSFLGGAEISCIAIECPSLFRPPLEKGCYEVFEDDNCCSVDIKCVDYDGKNQENVTEPTCEYDGMTYYRGERIYLVDDLCKSCLCDENWDGVNYDRCHIEECLMERKLRDLRRGCIPIYHVHACCPFEFHCGSGNEANLNDTLVPKSEGGCSFEGKSYSVGEEIDIHHPTNCVTCTCTTPPDFTCIHIACPHPPNDDYENCRAVFYEDVCCPTYECLYHSVRYICAPETCENGCKEAFVPDGYGLCQCDIALCKCKCPEACEVDYDVLGGTCPPCKCPITVQFAPVQCSPVKCDPQCFEAVGSDGCLMCNCGPLCSAPKCDAECSIQIDIPLGQCPGCVCPSTQDHGLADGQQIQCAPVKCGPACREAVGQFGCPTCFCDPLCSPPICDPGCEIETVPSSGPCPGCVCRDQPTHNIQCAPVKCGPTCREGTGQFGCPVCLCDPLCSPLKCDPGCEVELVPSLGGPCLGCVCKNDQKSSDVQCAPVKCGPQCREAVGQFGCPVCHCDPLCSPPKCDPGCEIETVPSSGLCPGCVCKDKQEAKVQCAPVKCGPQCHEGVGQFGCPMCICDPACSPPKCFPGCRAEVVPSLGPCPGCVCGDKKDNSQSKIYLWDVYYI